MKGFRRAIIIGGLVFAGARALRAFRQRVRPWYRNWGATPGEVEAALPGDDIVAEPAGMTTRAITIDAPPAAVWPWLVQMGQGRGGAYTYDWIENLLGLKMHSANRILPEFQNAQVGDVVLRTPASEMRIQAMAPERYMVAAATDSNWSWSFVLTPLAGGRTRMISRNRWPVGECLGQRLMMLFMEPASLVMERKMLFGFKQRAERKVATSTAPGADGGAPTETPREPERSHSWPAEPVASR